jgi:hypothetical protein
MANGFTDEDDALLAELGVEVEAKKHQSPAPRVKSGSSRGLKRSSALSRSTAAARSMARTGISSSAFMQFASTGSAESRNAAT